MIQQTEEWERRWAEAEAECAGITIQSRVKNPDHVAAQENYCKAHSLRNWVNLGDCFSCHRNVFDAYSVTYVANNQITGCPYCHRSFCE